MSISKCSSVLLTCALVVPQGLCPICDGNLTFAKHGTAAKIIVRYDLSVILMLLESVTSPKNNQFKYL